MRIIGDQHGLRGEGEGVETQSVDATPNASVAVKTDEEAIPSDAAAATNDSNDKDAVETSTSIKEGHIHDGKNTNETQETTNKTSDTTASKANPASIDKKTDKTVSSHSGVTSAQDPAKRNDSSDTIDPPAPKSIEKDVVATTSLHAEKNDVKVAVVSSSELIAKLSKRFPHASCIKDLDFHAFKSRTLLANAGQSGQVPGAKGSGQVGAARGKISRYVQNQALALGQNWKKALEDERKAAAMPGVHHAHHLQSPTRGKNDSGEKVPRVNMSDDDEEDAQDQEEYFSPLHLEVERILGCDENELDMNVLARQRAINLRDEQQALKKREEEDAEEEWWLKGDAPIHSEQNEVSRRRFVDEVEDFWLRQKAPTPVGVNKISKASHPHPRDFKKMNESPVFGVSSVVRPIAKLDGEEDLDLTIDKDPGVEYKLRGYQLEGVNWLTWNWYNTRSCILADEMGLGKTIQSIGFLTQIQRIPRAHVRGPFLIVAPLSLVSQWESESKEWAPDMNTVVNPDV